LWPPERNPDYISALETEQRCDLIFVKQRLRLEGGCCDVVWKQRCDLVFISWTYNGHKLNVTFNVTEQQAVYYTPRVGQLVCACLVVRTVVCLVWQCSHS